MRAQPLTEILPIDCCCVCIFPNRMRRQHIIELLSLNHWYDSVPFNSFDISDTVTILWSLVCTCTMYIILWLYRYYAMVSLAIQFISIKSFRIAQLIKSNLISHFSHTTKNKWFLLLSCCCCCCLFYLFSTKQHDSINQIFTPQIITYIWISYFCCSQRSYEHIEQMSIVFVIILNEKVTNPKQKNGIQCVFGAVQCGARFI